MGKKNELDWDDCQVEKGARARMMDDRGGH